MGNSFDKMVYFPENIKDKTKLEQIISKFHAPIHEEIRRLLQQEWVFDSCIYDSNFQKNLCKLIENTDYYSITLKQLETDILALLPYGGDFPYGMFSDSDYIEKCLLNPKTSPLLEKRNILRDERSYDYGTARLLDAYIYEHCVLAIDIPTKYEKALVCLDGDYRRNTTIKKIFEALHYSIESSEAQEQFEKDKQ